MIPDASASTVVQDSYTVMMQTCFPELITETVKEAAAATQQTLAEVSNSRLQAAQVPSQLERLFALSPYLSSTCQRYPEQLIWLLDTGALEQDAPAPTRDEHIQTLRTGLNSALGEFKPASNEAASVLLDQQLVRLRQFRHLEMTRILWRELVGHASVDDTLLALSTMADACIDVATHWAHDTVRQRFGDALDAQGNAMQMMVLGMGKLGGQELNVSSDIDLIYIYPRAGHSSSESSIDNEAYFRRVAQLLSQLLGNVTGDGFAFRVDTRLRPFGESGPLVINLSALEQYYLTQGRNWERYAMIKARPIVGVPEDIALLDEIIKPFVYRRYLDYSAIDALRDLKRKIALMVKQKSMHNNVKLGLGGIREIEFIGQAFQLVRGGRIDSLHVRPIKQVLRQLREEQLMSETDVNALCLSYDFLRRVENALQAMRDQQVHSLPTDAEDKHRLIGMIGFNDWDSFEHSLDQHRQAVSARFNALFSDWNADESDASASLNDSVEIAWAVLSSPEVPEGSAEEAIRSLGMEPGEELMEALRDVTRGSFYQRLTSRSQGRVDRILPLLVDAAMEQQQPSQALVRCLNLVRTVAGRSGYLQILIERPPALARLVGLFSKSAWVATFVSRHPIVIDELLRSGATDVLPTREQVLAEAMEEAHRAKVLDLEEQMDALRQFQQARELRIAAAELNDNLPLMRVSDQLSWLAEAVIAAVVFLVKDALDQRFGRPTYREQGECCFSELGIVAYGKLGGLELGYGSDLDVVFLHDSIGENQYTDGEKSIENGVYYARLAQKVVHFMTTHTPAGVLYDIDLRLRPNGQSGVLVTAFESFAQYQSEKAWTWEHQALVRARVVLGGERINTRFNDIRMHVLAQRRKPAALAREVVDMRARMHENLGRGKDGEMHLKNDPGGVADLEFMVQYLVLAHAATCADLLLFSDNARILDEAARAGIMDAQESLQLKQHYLSLRRLVHRQALQQESVIVAKSEELVNISGQVIESWNRLLVNPYA